MKYKKKIIIGITSLAIIMTTTGFFSWYNTSNKTTPNMFYIDNFDVKLTESSKDYNIPLITGTTIKKQISVTNNGNVPVIVRIKLEEILQLLEQNTIENINQAKITYVSDTNNVTDQYVKVLLSDTMIQTYTANDYISIDNIDNKSPNYINPNNITVLYKTTQIDENNKMYSYLGYVTTPESNTTNHHLVKLTPNYDSEKKLTGFTIEYAYYTLKENMNNNSDNKYTQQGIHGVIEDENYINQYYNRQPSIQFHDDIILNFNEHVITDGSDLSNDTTWFLDTDGYFYYTKPLKEKSVSEPLLESISIKEITDDTLKGASYTIIPIMEAVQCNYEAATATWTTLTGNPAISGAPVKQGDAHQLIYNISNFGNASKTNND